MTQPHQNKWEPGERVVYRDAFGKDVIATVQPGPCSKGPAFVCITWSGHSCVVWQDSLRLATADEVSV